MPVVQVLYIALSLNNTDKIMHANVNIQEKYDSRITLCTGLIGSPAQKLGAP